MKKFTFTLLAIALSLNVAYATEGNNGNGQPTHPVHPIHPVHPTHPVHPVHPTTPPPTVTVTPPPVQTNVNAGAASNANANSNANSNSNSNSNANANANGTGTGTGTGTGIGTGGTASATGAGGNASGGNSTASQSQSQQQSAVGSGNVTSINYEAAKIPVATAATLLLPPVVCASSSSGLGIQTQVLGFNFGNASSRKECWESKEATECVNLAVATSSLFGMRRLMAQVAVGCTVQSPSFRNFAKEMGKLPAEFATEILASYGEEQKMARDAEYSRLQEQLVAEQNARKQAEADRDAALVRVIETRTAPVAIPQVTVVEAPITEERQRAVTKKKIEIVKKR